MGVYIGLTLILLVLPLVNVLHAESCAVLAAAGFFIGGYDAVRRFVSAEGLYSVLRLEMLLLFIPLALFQMARAFVPGCDLATGLQYFVLFPMVSLVLAVSLAYVLTCRKQEKAPRRFVLIGLAVTVVPVIWDLGFHPQFYVYNHVFGGVLGPIYDLNLASRPGLYIFRLMTLIWADLFFLIGFRTRNPHRRRLVDAALPFVAAILGLAYWFGPQLGINTTSGTIVEGLGSSIQTEHFVIHYDDRVMPEPEARRIADDHEFRYSMMEQELGFSIDEPIMSYIYPTASIRAELTGAGYTNIAPVWLGKPQLHVLYESYDRSFAHELAHVFSRDMGLPVLHASLRVGLVEGFAVALEPPIGLPNATDQIAAIRNAPEFDSLYGGQSMASAVIASLSPFGFWSGRGAVSYTTMGSFVRYLLDTYGPDPFRQVYGMASFESAYGVRLTDLAEGWEASLLGRELPPAVTGLAASRFSVLSIFERQCPHDTPKAVRRYWDSLDLMQLGDTTNARIAIDDVLRLYPDFAPVLSVWSQLELQRGGAEGVVFRLNPVVSADSSMAAYLGIVMGDALAMEGRPLEAQVWYDLAEKWQSPFSRSILAILRDRRRLAAQPELVAAANQVGGRAAARIKLAQSSDPAARVQGAFLAFHDYDFQEAFRILSKPAGPDTTSTAGARRFAWTASFAYLAGEYHEAERFRNLAVEAADLEGDVYEVERLKDFGKRIAWAREAKRQ